MVQMIPAAKTFGGEFAKAFGGGAGKGFSESYDENRKKKLADVAEKKEVDTVKQLIGEDTTGMAPEFRKAYVIQKLKSKGKEDLFNQKQEWFNNKYGQPSQGDQLRGDGSPDMAQENGNNGMQEPNGFDASKMSQKDRLEALIVDADVGKFLQHENDVALREKRENEKSKEKKFESNRAYHTQFTKPTFEKANNLRNSLPKQEMAIDFARNSIESGEVGAFTMNHLADIFGADSLRNAKGAQLILASKEQLIPNLGRISAKAQNVFMEKRISSMIPQVGLKDEANLTMQEMIEGEAAIDRAYLTELDRISDEDTKEYGFEKKDWDKRARNAAASKEKEIVKRTSYRLKEIEENSKGLSGIKKEVGKNVVNGTPLTLAMAKLYKEKYKDDALKIAEKNGYYIPTLEEFKIFQQRPKEFREEL